MRKQLAQNQHIQFLLGDLNNFTTTSSRQTSPFSASTPDCAVVDRSIGVSVTPFKEFDWAASQKNWVLLTSSKRFLGFCSKCQGFITSNGGLSPMCARRLRMAVCFPRPRNIVSYFGHTYSIIVYVLSWIYTTYCANRILYKESQVAKSKKSQ